LNSKHLCASLAELSSIGTFSSKETGFKKTSQEIQGTIFYSLALTDFTTLNISTYPKKDFFGKLFDKNSKLFYNFLMGQ
jgi:hypothetical protein